MGNLLIGLAGAIPIVVLLIATLHSRRKRKQRGERPPQQDKLLRLPGHSLQAQLESLNEGFSEWMMLAFLATLIALGVISYKPLANELAALIASLLGAVASAGCTIRAWRILERARACRIGLLGEQAVAEQLNHLIADGYHIFQDVPGSGNWNIDHVAVGPAGVFAIETKARTKKPGPNNQRDCEVVFDGNSLQFPHYRESKAISQAQRNSNWLAGELTQATGERVAVRAIIAIPGWFVTLKANSPLKVLNSKQVPGFIAKEQTVLSAQEISRISYQLERRCRSVEF